MDLGGNWTWIWIQVPLPWRILKWQDVTEIVNQGEPKWIDYPVLKHPLHPRASKETTCRLIESSYPSSLHWSWNHWFSRVEGGWFFHSFFFFGQEQKKKVTELEEVEREWDGRKWRFRKETRKRDRMNGERQGKQGREMERRKKRGEIKIFSFLASLDPPSRLSTSNHLRVLQQYYGYLGPHDSFRDSIFWSLCYHSEPLLTFCQIHCF